ncbi:MAG TPA: phosphopantetheine-binding protein [Gaiellaceae bacterium]|nr:phosphopantetheine-binding protein [Gaiellaceae bacterium]
MIERLWKRMLGLDVAAPDDDFFELGGNSLLAAQLIAEIREETGHALPVREFFVAPQLRTLLALGRAGSSAM